eukprot:INCI12369.2.p1 GENE.INCI12369.2~~INCI12369.2.p1  ORF type:complete len:358 (-),score=39.46 INCI12369.2:1050-2123(-)
MAPCTCRQVVLTRAQARRTTLSVLSTRPLRKCTRMASFTGSRGSTRTSPRSTRRVSQFSPHQQVLMQPALTFFSGLNKYPTTGLSVNMNGTTIRGFGFRQTRGYASSYGAVYVSIKGGLTIEDCIFTDNSIGISVLSGSATIRNCHFDTHTTSSSGMDGTGTAVAFMYSDFSGGGVVNVANSTFAGPGLAFKVNDGPAVLQVNDSSFEDLWGVASSGYLNGVMDLQVRTSSFKNVTQAFRLYGMQSPAKGLVGIDSCEFRSGGGASVNGGVVTVGADIAVAIKNSSFVGHQGLQGAVLNCQDQASVTVLDSTFAGNSAEDGSPGWCSKSCGFVAANNVLSKNSEHKDTGPCAGLNTA